MTDPFRDLYNEEDPFADLFEEEKKKKPGLFTGLGEGLKQGLKGSARVLKNLGDPLGAAKYGVEQAANPIQPLPEAESGMQSAGRFVGQVLGELPVTAPLGSMFGSVGRGAISAALGPAASKAGAFGRAAVAGMPGNVAAGLTTETVLRPGETLNRDGIVRTAAYSTLGAAFDGLFGVRAFNKQQAAVELAKNIEAARTVDPQDLVDKVNAFKDEMDALLVGRPIQVQRADAARIIREVETPRFRDVKPARGRIPNDVNVAGYAEELSSDIQQRNKIAQRMTQILNKINKGSHSEADLNKLVELRDQFDALSLKIGKDVNSIGDAASEITGQRFIKGTDRPTVVRSQGNQPESNMRKGSPASPRLINPINEALEPRVEQFSGGSPTAPGSGNQSPYKYAPPEAGIDPIAKALDPKVTGTGNVFAGLSPEENELAKMIDFGNEEANALRMQRRYLLDTPGKVIDTKVFDFLRPTKEVDAQAHDMATKFLRHRMKGMAAVEDALYIPSKDNPGAYTRGKSSLMDMFRALNGDADLLNRAQLYIHARQQTSGIDTPFNPEAAKKVVDMYEQEYPEIVKMYNEMYLPFVNDMLQMVDGYGLTSLDNIQNMLMNPEYAPLTRSIFADIGKTYRFLKGRTNPTSEKVVEPLWQTLYDNVQGIVRAGERAKVLRALAEARMKNESLAGAIEIQDAVTPDGAAEIIEKLGKDAPEKLKQAMVDIFAANKGNNYNVWINDKKVSVAILDPALQSSLEMMQFSGWKNFTPDNFSPGWKAVLSPAQSTAKVEKAITGSYSVYRDIFAFGLPIDAAEVQANAASLGYKFNMFTDPLKGFLALYRNDPALKDLVGHSGILSFRYADPMAEVSAKNVEDLIKLSRNKGLKLRVMHPLRAMKELAGNLSNASRAGLVLANPDRPMSELASLYNSVIGDPAVSGAVLGSMSRYTGFLNYPLQATKAGVKAAGNLAAMMKNPVQNADKLGFALARIGGFLVGPTLLHAYLTKDNDPVKELEKDPAGSRFMYIPMPGGEVVAFPKPQGLAGLLGVSLPQRAMRELLDSGRTDLAELVAKDAFETLMPNFVPLTADMAYGALTGNRLNPRMADYPIVPTSRQRLLPEDAGPAGSTNTAQFLAQATGMDAGKWDNIMRTFLIGTTFNAFQQADYALGDKKGPPVENKFTWLPGVRSVNEATAGTYNVNKFYDKLADIGATLQSLNRRINDGRPDAAMEIVNNQMGLLEQASVLEVYASQIKYLTSRMNEIRYNEFMTAEEKQKELDYMTKERIRIARSGLADLENMQKKK